MNRLLDSNSILLIDVRNRTELNTVGQIPGSVCLPLHEVAAAMELSPEEFSAKYGFEKPDPDNRKIVLTCRSGRRVLVRFFRGSNPVFDYNSNPCPWHCIEDCI